MQQVRHTLRVLPVHIIDPKVDKEQSILIGEELESLISTLGGEIVASVMQRMDKPHSQMFIGTGKAAEVATLIKEHDVDVVIIGAMAKPRQIHALKTLFQKANPQIDVWDRIDLILHIFDKHASTTEAKLQIELARMRYMGPRIYGMGFVMSQQGGGIGTLGVGETNTELMKRHWRAEMKQVTDKLAKITTNHETQLEKRKRGGYKTVSIVGYTNAGKSSLFGALTGKKALAEDELFATLDSAVGNMYVPSLGTSILLTDTIGFIRDLPPRLIDAFKSTLMESVHADILIHVIDASDPEVATKIQVVDNILQSLRGNTDKVIYVFNKIDVPGVDVKKLEKEFSDYAPLFISVKENKNLQSLKDEVASIIKLHFSKTKT